MSHQLNRPRADSEASDLECRQLERSLYQGPRGACQVQELSLSKSGVFIRRVVIQVNKVSTLLTKNLIRISKERKEEETVSKDKEALNEILVQLTPATNPNTRQSSHDPCHRSLPQTKYLQKLERINQNRQVKKNNRLLSSKKMLSKLHKNLVRRQRRSSLCRASQQNLMQTPTSYRLGHQSLQ